MNELLLIAVAFALGGILKGATGAGAPIIAVPVLASLYGVPFAVAVFIFPNFITNSLQIHQFREHLKNPRFALLFGGAGFVGGAIGTIMLASLSPDTLKLLVGLVVVLYIVFRMFRPDWALSHAAAQWLVTPLGVIAGILQGATGVSAPVTITFLNAMRLERSVFVPTISIFFLSLAMVQLPLLMWFGIMDGRMMLYSLAACLPLVAAMPVGAYLVRHISKTTFDRTILILLAILAVKLLWEVLG
jgi:hypothetical protein